MSAGGESAERSPRLVPRLRDRVRGRSAQQVERLADPGRVRAWRSGLLNGGEIGYLEAVR
jgi:hypothetical protein